jgi:hypothetical protein
MYGPGVYDGPSIAVRDPLGRLVRHGTHQATRHMGNAVASDPADLQRDGHAASVHVTDLEGRFDQTGYLSLHSDLVGLLVSSTRQRC